MQRRELPIHGRGVSSNPTNRFERLTLEPNPDDALEDAPAPVTQFYRDESRSVLTRNDSPDVGFNVSVNPYRGCEHGCVYCYARPYHEYLGFSAGLDFETRIMVKEDAPELLRRELMNPRWTPEPIGLCGVTDAYQPVERRLRLTRRCLEVLAEFRNPVTVVTKNRLVTRDADLLGGLAAVGAASVYLAVTTLDSDLAAVMEPRASRPPARLEAIRELSAAGVAVGVLIAPVIPGLTDHELPAILKAAAEAGATFAGYVMLRLPHGLPEMFASWLDQHYPDKKERILGRVRDMRGGTLNDPRFGVRMVGEGVLAEQVRALFRLSCRRQGLRSGGLALSTAAFRRPGGQMLLFE